MEASLAAVNTFSMPQPVQASSRDDVASSGDQPGSAPHARDVDTPQPCSFYLRTGTCAYGDKCKYYHPKDRKPPMLNSQGYPLRLDQPECTFYVRKGWCAFGASCKYHHSEEIAAASAHNPQHHAANQQRLRGPPGSGPGRGPPLGLVQQQSPQQQGIRHGPAAAVSSPFGMFMPAHPASPAAMRPSMMPLQYGYGYAPCYPYYSPTAGGGMIAAMHPGAALLAGSMPMVAAVPMQQLAMPAGAGVAGAGRNTFRPANSGGGSYRGHARDVALVGGRQGGSERRHRGGRRSNAASTHAAPQGPGRAGAAVMTAASAPDGPVDAHLPGGAGGEDAVAGGDHVACLANGLQQLHMADE